MGRFLLVLTKFSFFQEEWALAYHSTEFRHFTKVVWQLMRQLVYSIFISNNRASAHLWWKENLVKHQRVTKYYENDCRKFGFLKYKEFFNLRARKFHFLKYKIFFRGEFFFNFFELVLRSAPGSSISPYYTTRRLYWT